MKDDLPHSLRLAADAYESEARDATAHLLREAADALSALTKRLELVRAQVLVAIEEEDLFDATGTTEDEAYSAGVKDALRAATSVFDGLLSRAAAEGGSDDLKD